MPNCSAGKRRQELVESQPDRRKMLQRQGCVEWRTAAVAVVVVEIQGCWFGAVVRRCRAPPAQPMIQVIGDFSYRLYLYRRTGDFTPDNNHRRLSLSTDGAKCAVDNLSGEILL